jgi:predicted branched-subunit amino acid permease
VVTIVTTSAVYLTWILAALAGSVWGGIVIGATFGLVRALPMLLVARVDSPGRLRARLRSLAAAAPAAAVVTTVMVGTLPVVALLALTLGGAT